MAETMLTLASIIRLGKSDLVAKKITEDDLDRLSTTIRLIDDQWSEADDIFLNQCRASLELMLSAKGDTYRHESTATKRSRIVQVKRLECEHANDIWAHNFVGRQDDFVLATKRACWRHSRDRQLVRLEPIAGARHGAEGVQV